MDAEYSGGVVYPMSSYRILDNSDNKNVLYVYPRGTLWFLDRKNRALSYANLALKHRWFAVTSGKVNVYHFFNVSKHSEMAAQRVGQSIQ